MSSTESRKIYDGEQRLTQSSTLDDQMSSLRQFHSLSENSDVKGTLSEPALIKTRCTTPTESSKEIVGRQMDGRLSCDKLSGGSQKSKCASIFGKTASDGLAMESISTRESFQNLRSVHSTPVKSFYGIS